MALIDYNEAARRYDAGRGLPLEGLSAWREAVTPFIADLQRPVVDVGSGTGQWATAFAAWFDADVIAVEPSRGMRGRAMARGRDRRVQHVAGDASHLPLRNASIGAAWLSTVIHHIPDLVATARELRRVLCEGAPVLIRSAFPGRHEGITLFRYFPAAARVAETFPTVEQTVAAFAEAGFARESLNGVPQESVDSLEAYRRRVAHQRAADTTMRALTDDEFGAGVAHIDRAIAEGAHTGPVIDTLDLLVLR